MGRISDKKEAAQKGARQLQCVSLQLLGTLATSRTRLTGLGSPDALDLGRKRADALIEHIDILGEHGVLLFQEADVAT
jgi:hypothetical protein